MADYAVVNLDRLVNMFGAFSDIPDDVKKQMLTDMGNAASAAIREMGNAYGIRDEESSQHILDTISLREPELWDDGGHISITFAGERTDANHVKPVRNAEIAFINEFGKQGQRARPFIKTALAEKEEQIVRAGLKAFDEWFNQTFNN